MALSFRLDWQNLNGVIGQTIRRARAKLVIQVVHPPVCLDSHLFMDGCLKWYLLYVVVVGTFSLLC